MHDFPRQSVGKKAQITDKARFDMTKLDLKRGLGRSIIRCFSAPLADCQCWARSNASQTGLLQHWLASLQYWFYAGWGGYIFFSLFFFALFSFCPPFILTFLKQKWITGDKLDLAGMITLWWTSTNLCSYLDYVRIRTGDIFYYGKSPFQIELCLPL